MHIITKFYSLLGKRACNSDYNIKTGEILKWVKIAHSFPENVKEPSGFHNGSNFLDLRIIFNFAGRPFAMPALYSWAH